MSFLLRPPRRIARALLSQPEDLVLIGLIGQPHGLDGAVRLRPIGEAARLATVKRVYLEGSGWRVVRSWDLKGGDPILRLTGTGGRGGASALTGKSAYADEGSLALEEGEYLYADLIGRPVLSPAGEPLGVVADIYDSGPQDLLVVRREGSEYLVPLQAPYVKVLPDAIEVEPFPGLLDDDAESA
jgi:16S rRNA processing protein RimM